MKNKLWFKVSLTAILLIGFSLFGFKLGSFLLADMFSAQSEDAFKALDFNAALNFADNSISLNPREPSYYRRRAKILLLSPSIAAHRKELSLGDLKTSISLNPEDLATLRNAIPLYYYLSMENIFVHEDENIIVDERFIWQTDHFYKFLKETYPNDVGILVSLAHYQKKLNLEKDYLETIQMIEALRSDLLEWHPLLLD